MVRKDATFSAPVAIVRPALSRLPTGPSREQVIWSPSSGCGKKFSSRFQPLAAVGLHLRGDHELGLPLFRAAAVIYRYEARRGAGSPESNTLSTAKPDSLSITAVNWSIMA